MKDEVGSKRFVSWLQGFFALERLMRFKKYNMVRDITKVSGVGGKRFLISLVKCEFMEN